MQNESHGDLLQNATGHATKITQKTINGKPVRYISRYTQATFHNIMETARILYPDSVATSTIKRKRCDLPQIDPDKLLTDCSARGILLFDLDHQTTSLQPTQSEFNEDKVLSIAKDTHPTDDRIIISRDNFVIDGHHRWLAAYNKGNKTIPCRQINLNADQVFDFLQGKDYTTSESIHESISSLLENEDFILAMQCLDECRDGGLTETEAITKTAEACLIEESDLQTIIQIIETATKNDKLDVLINDFCSKGKQLRQKRRDDFPKVTDEDEMNVADANDSSPFSASSQSPDGIAVNPAVPGLMG